MINPKILRESPEILQSSLKHRGCSPDIFNTLKNLDLNWRKEQQLLETLQGEKNRSVPKGKPTSEEREKLMELSQRLKSQQQVVNDIKVQLDQFSF